MGRRAGTEKRREEIIKATFKCISKKGYNNLIMQDIAEEVGLSKGVLHYYFKDKEDLLKHVLHSLVKELEEILGEEVQRAQSAEEKLRAIIRGWFEGATRNKVIYYVLIDFWGETTKKDVFNYISSNFYARNRYLTKKIIDEGIEEGIFKEVDSNYVAALFLSILDGMSLQWIIDEKAFDLEEGTKLCEELLMAFLKKDCNP